MYMYALEKSTNSDLCDQASLKCAQCSAGTQYFALPQKAVSNIMWELERITI